jgi:carboxypeptidase Q
MDCVSVAIRSDWCSRGKNAPLSRSVRRVGAIARTGACVAALVSGLVGSFASPTPLSAQSFPTSDPVLRKIWTLGMDSSQTYPLAQALLDSIGPRLTGTPQQAAAIDWTISKLTQWGISAQKVQYGTWKGWNRGHTHLDLVTPRVRTLEAMLMAWSPGTGGKNVEAEVVTLPAHIQSPSDFEAWLPSAKGKFVLISFPQPTCRPDDDWKQWAAPGSFARMDSARARSYAAWTSKMSKIGIDPKEFPKRLEAAGVAGLFMNNWSRGWGVEKIFFGRTTKVPTVHVSCEDYGLLHRLAENNQGPKVRLNAAAEFKGEVPVYNVIAEIKGSEKPNEYVILSAHLDSWDAASGATDNGTGTVTMLEAIRILKAVYPQPKRSIIVALWSAEEQGLVGSRAFVADRPEVVEGLQALFNQDNGTGRVVSITGQGLTEAGAFLGKWFGRLPDELTRGITLTFPGGPTGGGSDYASFVCAGAPGFSLSSLNWNYTTYTWHTNRDTFDKISFDDLKANAVLTAMLAYLASEEPTKIPRDRRVFERGWPNCEQPVRNSQAWTR